MTPLEGFTNWLPGELVYAATKPGNGYHTRLERALLKEGDGSMYTFMGTEWHNAQQMHAQGFDYATYYGKSAQQQLAKFVAGIYDTAAAITWQFESGEKDTQAYASHAEKTAALILKQRPWDVINLASFDPANERHLPYKSTIFAGGILSLQQNYVAAVARQDKPEGPAEAEMVHTQAIALGTLALFCYLDFAKNLEPEQIAIPTSGA